MLGDIEVQDAPTFVTDDEKALSTLKRAARDPDPVRRWLTFLRNHREAIAAMDLFTVPTITFIQREIVPKHQNRA
jgi:hypothetical protein